MAITDVPSIVQTDAAWCPCTDWGVSAETSNSQQLEIPDERRLLLFEQTVMNSSQGRNEILWRLTACVCVHEALP